MEALMRVQDTIKSFRVCVGYIYFVIIMLSCDNRRKLASVLCDHRQNSLTGIGSLDQLT